MCIFICSRADSTSLLYTLTHTHTHTHTHARARTHILLPCFAHIPPSPQDVSAAYFDELERRRGELEGQLVNVGLDNVDFVVFRTGALSGYVKDGDAL